MVLVLIVVMPLTLLNSTSITRPVHHARDIALAIAEGDLTRTIHVHGKDETADLLRALDHMQRALRTLVGEVRQRPAHPHGVPRDRRRQCRPEQPHRTDRQHLEETPAPWKS
jgi:nitrogen fixation/metabolism regulation signal transduction histidine kinase